MKKRKLLAIIFSLVLAFIFILCLIINLILNGHLTWSLITNLSLILIWIIFFPIIYFPHRQGPLISLILLSFSLIPYLAILFHLLNKSYLFKSCFIFSIIFIIYLWGLYIILVKLGKRKLLATGTYLLLTALFYFIITLIHPLQDNLSLKLNNIIVIFLLLIFSFINYLSEYLANKRLKKLMYEVISKQVINSKKK